MTRHRAGLLLGIGFLLTAIWSVPLHAEMCNGNPNWKPRYKGDFCPIPLHSGSSGSPSGTSSAQQRIDEINRNTAAAQQNIQQSFDRLRDILKNQSSSQTNSDDDDDEVETGSAPYVSDRRDKYLPSDSVDVDDLAVQRAAREQERAERQREREAADLLKDARSLQDCLAAMSTYRSGPQRDMPAGCLSDIDQMSVYRSSARSPAPQPSTFNVDTIIDGSNIPASIDYSNSPTAAIDRVFTGPPVPPPVQQPNPSGPSDVDRGPDSPSMKLLPYDSSMPPLPPPGTRPWNGGPISPAASEDDGPMAKLEILPTHPREPNWFDNFMDFLDRHELAPARPGPMRQLGAPDDSLSNHQADMDNATSIWKFLNPLKYPLRIQRTVNDKMDRVQEFQPPEDK